MNGAGPSSGGTGVLGRWMIVGAWVVLLVLLVGLFQDLLDRQVNPNRNPQTGSGPGGVVEVILERNARGHYVVSGQINGQAVDFLVDTGATEVAVPEGLAARLALSRQGGAFSRTANGVVAVWQTRLADVSIGEISLQDVRAVIMPSMGVGDQVLLGMSFLEQLEIIQRDGMLTLRQ